jgi:hypothetical protein
MSLEISQLRYKSDLLRMTFVEVGLFEISRACLQNL